MIEGGLPLELGGRRPARIRVAEREADIRRLAVAERERLLAAEVRSKFGEALAAVFRLRFVEETLAAATENYRLVSALVDEGRRPPLEQNMETVELNRIRAMRERAEGDVEIRLFELRNLIGLAPSEPLRLQGDFDDLLAPTAVPSADSVSAILAARPDLLGARAVEDLALARVEQARSEGRVEADVMLGYQQMKSGFPFSAFDGDGRLMPIENKMRFFTFGVKLMIPVRNRNQGMVVAAVLESEAASRRREFGELTVRREIAAAFARYERAGRAMQIYRAGVRDQAAANLNVVRQTYELGSKTLLDYIAEQRRFIETETEYIDAQLEVYLARVEILRVTAAPQLTGK
jgi:cobalt-zinc-cadmium efflux system outer membrane protein